MKTKLNISDFIAIVNVSMRGNCSSWRTGRKLGKSTSTGVRQFMQKPSFRRMKYTVILSIFPLNDVCLLVRSQNADAALITCLNNQASFWLIVIHDTPL